MLSQYKTLNVHLMTNALDTETGANENAIQKFSLPCLPSNKQHFNTGSISENSETFYK